MFKATVYNLFNSSTQTTVVQTELKQILQVILSWMLTRAQQLAALVPVMYHLLLVMSFNQKLK